MGFLNIYLLSIYILSINCNSPEIVDFASVDYIFSERVKPLFMEQFQYILSPDLYMKIMDLFELTNSIKAKEIMENRFSQEEQNRIKRAANTIMINYYRAMDHWNDIDSAIEEEEEKEQEEEYIEEYYDSYKNEL